MDPNPSFSRRRPAGSNHLLGAAPRGGPSGSHRSRLLPPTLVGVNELRLIFHQQLEAIEEKVIQLFAYVAEDVAVATEALLSGDTGAFKLLIEREELIDGLYRELEDLVNDQLALQAPVAGDLRLLLSTLRIVPELERSHDLVVHIAEQATHLLSDDLTPRTRGLVQRMAEISGDMWTRAGDAWHDRDPAAVDELEERDDGLDSLHSALTAELASGKTSVPVAMDMTLVARYYERLGDHAVNVARRIVFLSGGSQPAG